MPLIRGISRGLWRTLSSQGGQLPLEAEVKTPIQTVQVVDDVSNTIARVATPNGFCTVLIPAGSLTGTNQALVRFTAGEGGLQLFFDPSGIFSVSAETTTPTPVAGSVNICDFSGVGMGSVISFHEDTLVNRATAPTVSVPTVFWPDWITIPSGNSVEFCLTLLVATTMLQTFQYREALGS